MGTNCTISRVATRPVELSNLRPLSASSTCNQAKVHVILSYNKPLHCHANEKRNLDK